MEPEIPAEAVRAAMVRRADLLADRPDPMVLSDETLTRLMLEAAAPILAEAWGVVRPRERIDWPGAWPRTAPNPADPSGLTVIPLPDPEASGA